jgi:hypothetical protein
VSPAFDTLRLETLLALSLSERWPSGNGSATAETDSDLPVPLNTLKTSDQRAIRILLRAYRKLTPPDQDEWRANRLTRIRTVSRERNRRFDRSIHTSQIVEALSDEPKLIQTIITRTLPASHRNRVAAALNLEIPDATSDHLLDHSSRPPIVNIVCQGFFERFVDADNLKDAVAFDLLSTIELARLIRVLGARETAIACQGIAAVEAVTAFLKRFSAEDTHAIVSNFSVVKTVDPERLQIAEQLVQRAINAGSGAAAAMLDRVGLSLLAIVLETRGPLRRRHIVQKLSIQAAGEVGELMGQAVCDAQMILRLVEEVEALAVKLHHATSELGEERRGIPSLY